MSAVKFNAKVIQLLEKQYVDYLYRKYVNTNESARDTEEDYINKVFITLAEMTIKNELDEIRRATELYDENPDRYPALKTEFGYPDAFRCKHICCQKNKYWRCKQKKNKGDADYCTQHLVIPNTYAETYRQVCIKVSTMVD